MSQEQKFNRAETVIGFFIIMFFFLATIYALGFNRGFKNGLIMHEEMINEKFECLNESINNMSVDEECVLNWSEKWNPLIYEWGDLIG